MRIFMTGATSGLGKEAAITLAGEGAQLWYLSRNKELSDALSKEFKQRYPDSPGRLIPVKGDLADLQSVKAACDAVMKETDYLDVLIYNAGIWNFSFRETKDGLEETWQVNVLSHVLITNLLISQLKKGSDPKILLTASGLHQGKIYFDDPGFRGSFSGFKSYRQSKLAMMLLTRHWAKVLEGEGVLVCCQHPGLVDTRLGRDAGWFARWFFKTFGRSTVKGAETLIYLAQSNSNQLEAGAFYKDKKVHKTTAYSYRLDEAEKLENILQKELADRGL